MEVGAGSPMSCDVACMKFFFKHYGIHTTTYWYGMYMFFFWQFLPHTCRHTIDFRSCADDHAHLASAYSSAPFPRRYSASCACP